MKVNSAPVQMMKQWARSDVDADHLKVAVSLRESCWKRGAQKQEPYILLSFFFFNQMSSFILRLNGNNGLCRNLGQ